MYNMDRYNAHPVNYNAKVAVTCDSYFFSWISIIELGGIISETKEGRLSMKHRIFKRALSAAVSLALCFTQMAPVLAAEDGASAIDGAAFAADDASIAEDNMPDDENALSETGTEAISDTDEKERSEEKPSDTGTEKTYDIDEGNLSEEESPSDEPSEEESSEEESSEEESFEEELFEEEGSEALKDSADLHEESEVLQENTAEEVEENITEDAENEENTTEESVGDEDSSETSEQADALYDSIPNTGFENTIEGDMVSLDKYIGNDTNVVVPSSVSYNGKSYTTMTKNTAFQGNTYITTVEFEDGAWINPVSQSMFEGCSSLKSVDLSAVANFGNLSNLSRMFYGCSNLVSVSLGENRSNWATDLSHMFEGCSMLNQISWNGFVATKKSSVNTLDLTRMFYGCKSLPYLSINGVNLSHITSMEEMFSGCSSLQSVKFEFEEDAPSPAPTTMKGMFSGCENMLGADLSMFDTSKVLDMSSLFNGCKKLGAINMKGCNTSSVTNMYAMFKNCQVMSYLPVSDFDTKNVTDMGEMFHYCASLTNLDVSKFNTAKVTHMDAMFAGCRTLSSLSLTNFNTQNVTKMDGMFYMDSYLRELDLSSFSVSKNMNIPEMFWGCSRLERIYVSKDKWTIKSSDTMGENGKRMFTNCPKLVGGNGTNFDENCIDSNYAHIDSESDPGYLTGAAGPTYWDGYECICFGGTIFLKKYKGNDTKLSVPKSYTINKTPCTVCLSGSVYKDCGNIESISFAEGISLTDSVNELFSGCSSLETISGFDKLKTKGITGIAGMFSGCVNLKSVSLSGLDTSLITDMAHVFSGCAALSAIDVSGFDTKNATTMEGMFSGCTSLKKLTLSGFDTSQTTSMKEMFKNCSSLERLNLVSFNTAKVSDMSEMFSGCASLRSIVASGLWSTGKVSDSDNMFFGCTKLAGGNATPFDPAKVDKEYAGIDVSGYPGYLTDPNADPSIVDGFVYSISDSDIILREYTGDETIIHVPASISVGNQPYTVVLSGGVFEDKSKITAISFENGVRFRGDVSSLFKGCGKLAEIIGLTSVDTSEATSMASMFYECSALSSVDLSYFDTSNVTDMKMMFILSGLKTLDVSSFNTQKVENMMGMFASLDVVEIAGLKSFNTSNVKDMSYMFTGCSKLTSLDLSGFDTKNAATMEGMFSECKALKSLKITSFDTRAVESMAGMFSECCSLSSIDFPAGFDTGKVKNMYAMFAACQGLPAIDVSSFDTANAKDMSYMFAYCPYLEALELGSFDTANVSEMRAMFMDCEKLKTIYVSEKWSTKNVKTGTEMFSGCEKLSGPYTKYDSNNSNDYVFARIDEVGNPGYLTSVSALPDELKKSITGAAVSGIDAGYTYTGSAIKPVPTIKMGSKPLVEGKDYAVSYGENINAGSGAVVVSGMGQYIGTLEKVFAITEAAQSIKSVPTKAKSVVSGQTVAAKTVVSWIAPGVKKGAYVFSSKKPKIAAIDKKTGKIVAKATGTATIAVYIDRTANYSASPAKSFSVKVVAPSAPALKKAAASGKKLKATWNKQAAASGFIVEYAKDKRFKKSKGSFAVANKNGKQTTGTSPKKLSAGTWYVRMYAYGATNKIKSKASKTISVKIK